MINKFLSSTPFTLQDYSYCYDIRILTPENAHLYGMTSDSKSAYSSSLCSINYINKDDFNKLDEDVKILFDEITDVKSEHNGHYQYKPSKMTMTTDDDDLKKKVTALKEKVKTFIDTTQGYTRYNLFNKNEF